MNSERPTISGFNKFAKLLVQSTRLIACALIICSGGKLILGIRQVFSFRESSPPSNALESEVAENSLAMFDYLGPGTWVVEGSSWALAMSSATATATCDLIDNRLEPGAEIESDRAFLKSVRRLGALPYTKGAERGYRLTLGPYTLEVATETSESGLEFVRSLGLMSLLQGEMSQDVTLSRKPAAPDDFPLPLPAGAKIILRRYDTGNGLQLAVAEGAVIDDQFCTTMESNGVIIKTCSKEFLTVEYDNRAFVLWNASLVHRTIIIRQFKS